MSKLAILGGERVIAEKDVDKGLFHWPIVNDAMRAAQAKVLEDGNMSGTDIARKFEADFAKWQGRKYALAVMVEDGASGGGDCAPLAAEFLREYLHPVPPPPVKPAAEEVRP